jgi:hypothetical protein
MVLSSGVYLVVACSGAEPSELTSGGGSSGMSSSSGSTSSGGVPDTDDASFPPPPPPPLSDAIAPLPDASVIDASMTLDATSMDASPDAGDQDKNRVQCGDTMTGTYCATGVTCCATHPLASPTYDTFTCGGTCASPAATKLNCDDQNDCIGGQVCCARYTGSGGGPKIYPQSACMPASECSIVSGTSGGTQFCDLAGIAGECKGTRTCKKDPIFVGYATCQL